MINECFLLYLASRENGLQVPRPLFAKATQGDNVVNFASMVSSMRHDKFITKVSHSNYIIRFNITERGQLRLNDLRKQIKLIKE